jgi:hypothetical protein
MNLKYFILLLILFIVLIFLILININFKETFVCINPTKIDTNKICKSSFEMINNKNFLNNKTTNGYIKVDYKSDNRTFKNDGSIYYKCVDNWDGTLNNFNKVSPDNLNKNQFYNKLKQINAGLNFSNLELYKCNKTCPQGKGIIDNSNTCLDCPDNKYNTGDSYECKDIFECPSKYNLIKYDNKTGNISCKINSRPGYYYDVNSYSEKPCEKGTYTDSYGNSKCIDVSEGHYVDEIGQTTQKPYKTKCDYGKKLLNNGTTISDKTCEDCPPGHYSDGVTCTRVEAGYKLKEDRSGQVECQAGTYSNAGSESCIDCPSCSTGKYRSGCGGSSSGTCSPCPSCSTSKYRSDCSGLTSGSCTPCGNCSPGKYRKNCTGISPGHCESCQKGTHKNGNNNRTYCSPCPPNTWASIGFPNCLAHALTQCPPGADLIMGNATQNSWCYMR